MIKRLALIVLLSVATSPGWAADGDPSWYQRHSSWEETMRLSREALMAEVAAEDARFAEPEGDFRPVKHPVAFNQTQRVRIPVKGLSTLSISARSPALVCSVFIFQQDLKNHFAICNQVLSLVL